MGYSNKTEFEIALANALTSGNPSGSTVIPISSIGSSLTDTVSDEDVEQYIRWADANIDGALSGLYRVPLKRVNQGTFQLAMDVTAGDTTVFVDDSSRFIEGDVAVIRDDVNSQEVTVSAVPDSTRITFTGPVTSSYLASEGRVERIRFPEPVPKISARLAAAYFYDKHFAGQQEGNESEYGKHLRVLAWQDMNRILDGTIRLYLPDASDYMGRRYYNHALDDVIALRDDPKDRFKGQ